MTVNTSSFICQKKETTDGTAIITAVDTTTYRFGGWEKDQEINVPTPENEVNEYWNYSSRKPILQYGSKNFPEFVIKYHPNHPMAEYQFLGNATEGSPSTITLKDTGKKDAYTIRHEEQGGTNQLRQFVGSYCVGINGKIEMNKEEVVEQKWIYQSVEDDGDRSPLTTMPVFREGIESVYSGKPKVTYDSTEMPEIFRVDYSQQQQYSVVKTGSNNTINLHAYDPVELKLIGILSSNDEWDDLINQNTIDIEVRSFKQNDLTKYKDLKFTDCVVKKIEKNGKILEGAYLSAIFLRAENFTVDFIDEFGANFSDHMPTAP